MADSTVLIASSSSCTSGQLAMKWSSLLISNVLARSTSGDVCLVSAPRFGIVGILHFTIAVFFFFTYSPLGTLFHGAVSSWPYTATKRKLRNRTYLQTCEPSVCRLRRAQRQFFSSPCNARAVIRIADA